MARHLGINSAEAKGVQDRRFTPRAHGYDTYLGAPWTNAPMCAMDADGVAAKFATGPAFCMMFANDTVVEQPLRVEDFTATITEHAVSFIGRQTAARPWFFFMSYFHVHTPLFTNRTNRGRSAGGEFGDNIEEMDDSVGELIGAVERGGFARNTIVFVTSDNGPYQEEGWDRSGRTNLYDSHGRRTGRLRGGKGQVFEGGVRMPGAVVWPGVVAPGSRSDTLVSTMDIFPTIMAAAGIKLTHGIDGKDMTPVLRGATASQHEVLLQYCGFNLLAARVWGRFKVFWATQRWYTNDARNASICLECCNGVNPYSKLTGVTATELCGCDEDRGSKDVERLARPVVFDMLHDRGELRPIDGDAGWPADGNGSYAEVVARANDARARMQKAVHPKPSLSGAGTCTEGLPHPSLQPCCPGCHSPLLPMKPCRAAAGKKNCSCDLKTDDGESGADGRMFGVWYSGDPAVEKLPYIRGGQAMVQWSDVQPAIDVFNFSLLDTTLAAAEKGLRRDSKFTVQVNGNT